MQNLITLANKALDASGAVIRPYFRSGLAADDKADDSPVTLADRQAEETLRAILSAATPDFGIIGEEFPSHHQGEKYVWVIDPIDGTRAFMTGRPSFTTLLALLEDGVPVLGLIDQPVMRERWQGGRTLKTRFSSPYGGVVGPRTTVRLAQAELSATTPEMFRGEDMTRFERLQHAARRVYWGGDAYAFGLLALGQIDLVAETRLKIWDWAPLVPVIEAAGGVVTDWAGAKLKQGSDGSVLASANRVLHEEALAVLNA